MLTHDNLLHILDYDRDTGVFRWKIRASSRAMPGQVAGTVVVCTKSYVRRVIGINNDYYLAHRLAWFHVTGHWPIGEIDHINGDPLDNRYCNLRIATRSQNNMNSKGKPSKKGMPRGVRWHAQTSKWNARICCNKKVLSLGYFTAIEDAVNARRKAEEKYFGEFRRAA
jgi:hypothetical protein